MRSRSPRRTNKTINVRECKKKMARDRDEQKNTGESHAPTPHQPPHLCVPLRRRSVQGRRLEVIANVDDLGTQAVCRGQVAAAAAPPPEAATDVAAAPAAPCSHHAAAADTAAFALAPAPTALDAGLPGLEKLDEDVTVPLGARPMKRGELYWCRSGGRKGRRANNNEGPRGQRSEARGGAWVKRKRALSVRLRARGDAFVET